MKCTLRKVDGGIVATIDERLKQNQWYLDDTNQVRITYINDNDYWVQRKDYKYIIASTIPNDRKYIIGNHYWVKYRR